MKDDGTYRREFMVMPGSPAALISTRMGEFHLILYEGHDKAFTIFSEKDLSAAKNLADYVLCDLGLLSERARPAVSSFVRNVVEQLFESKGRQKAVHNPYSPDAEADMNPEGYDDIIEDEGIIDALKADPTMQLAIDGGVDGLKLVSAVKLQGLFQRISRKIAERFIDEEYVGVLDTKFGDVIVSLFTPLAVHAVMSHGPRMGLKIPGAQFMAAASAAAYRGQWVRIGLQYAPELADIPSLIAPELAQLMELGKMFMGGADADEETEPKAVAQDVGRDLDEARAEREREVVPLHERTG